MKSSLCWLCFVAVAFIGCANHDQQSAQSGAHFSSAGASTDPPAKMQPTASSQPIVTPAEGLSGKVIAYNDSGRFVVMEFPIGHLPAIGQKLFAYRNGLKVGEVSVSGPQRDDQIVGDVSAGEARISDAVRDH